MGVLYQTDVLSIFLIYILLMISKEICIPYARFSFM